MSSSVVPVESGSVVRIVLQFLHENGLHESFAALEKECSITLNLLSADRGGTVKSLKQHVMHGRWDRVLDAVHDLRLPQNLLADLFEHIIIELLEIGERDTAKTFLRQTPAMIELKNDQPDRVSRLERLIAQAFCSELTPERRKERRRDIADALESQLCTAPPSRLLTLINSALKWNEAQKPLSTGGGDNFDLLYGRTQSEASRDEEVAQNLVEKVPRRNERSIKLGDAHAECLVFSPDGASLATGNSHGFIEIWDARSGILRKDLAYQADDQLLMHADAVLSLAFSTDSSLLCSGSKDGACKVWRVQSGACLQRFTAAHDDAVACISFLSSDGTQIISGSHDNTVRVHGLRSGRTLRILRGHTAPINALLVHPYSASSVAVSGGVDGVVRVWNTKTGSCTASWRALPQHGVVDIPVQSLSWLPSRGDKVLLLIASRSAHLVLADVAAPADTDTAGRTVATLKGAASSVEMVSACCSVRGRYVFAVGSDSVLYCYDTHKCYELVHVLKVHKGVVSGIAHHPSSNIVASISIDSTLKLWRP